MKKMKLFITGSGGFIGRNLVETLESKYDIFAPRSKELDLTKMEAVDKYFKGKYFDVTIHCAVKPGHRNASSTENQLYTNLQMFSNLLKNRKNYKKLIFLGSGLGYNYQHYKPKMKENYFGSHIPTDEGGFSKYIISKFISEDKDMVDLRVFGVFGKYEDYAIRFISNMICKCLYDLPLTMNQNRKFDYVYINDLISIIEYFINNEVKHRAYNVTPYYSNNLYDIAKIVRTIAGKEHLPIKVDKAGMGVEYSGNNELLNNEIKNLKFTPLNQAIDELYNWYARNKRLIDKSLLLTDK